MIWSIFLLIVLCCNVLYVPVAISFVDIVLSPFAETCLNIIPNFCFIIEILVKFNTGNLEINKKHSYYYICTTSDQQRFITLFLAIYKKGLIIKSRKQIVITYMQKRFWQSSIIIFIILNNPIILYHYQFFKKRYDLFIVFCFFVGSYLNNAYLQTALLLRYFDIAQLIASLEDRYNLRERFYGIIDLFKLILFILFIAHLCGCIWHYIAVVESQSGFYSTWMGDGNAPFLNNWKSRYIDSLYWSVVTMCTLGYGDIVPVTPGEKLYTIGVTLISCFVFGYSVNQIGDILKEFLRIEEEFKVKMAKLNMYMKKRELNDDVSIKVRKYFEYLHKEKLQSNMEGAILIDSLENDLKSEVLKDIYGKLLRSKKLFKLNFDVESLSVKIKEKTIGLNEYVYKEGDEADCIYFLLKGQLEIIKTQTNTTFQKIEKGMMFGEIEFFTGQMRQFTIRSNSVSQLAYFNKQDFIEVLMKRKYDFEKFKKMQDQLFVYKDTQGLDHQCGTCGKYTHLLIDCPQINVVLNKQKTLSIYNFQVNQERKKEHKRQRNKYTCWRQKISLVQQLVHQFIRNEKLQLLEDIDQSQNFDDEDGEEENKKTNKDLNIRSQNEVKKISWNQLGENMKTRNKSTSQPNQNQEQSAKEKRESIVLNPRKRSRLSQQIIVPNMRNRNQSQIEKGRNQDKQKLTIINLRGNNENQKGALKENKRETQKENQKENSSNQNKVTLIDNNDDEIIADINYDSNLSIGELINKNKKRGLMPSFFDKKNAQQLKQKQLNNKNQKNNEQYKFQLMNQNQQDQSSSTSPFNNRFQELSETQYEDDNLRHKSSLTLSESSSEESSNSSQQNNKPTLISNNLLQQLNNNLDNDESNPYSDNIVSQENSQSQNQQEIINKLLNGGTLEEDENVKENFQEKEKNQQQEIGEQQKALLLLGTQNEDKEESLANLLIGITPSESIKGIYQKSSNKKIQSEGKNVKIQENITVNNEKSDKTLKFQQNSEISLKELGRALRDKRRSQISGDEQNIYSNHRQSQTSLSGKVKKKTILNQQPNQQPNVNLPNGQNIPVLNILSNLASEQKVIQNQKINENNPNFIQSNNKNYLNNSDHFKNITSQDIHNKMYGSVIATEVRKKVSILVTRKGTQDMPINVTLSVNKQEQDQLREVLELEQKLMKGSMLKKTMARKLSSKLRTKSNELFEKLERNQQRQQNQKFSEKLNEIENEDDDDEQNNTNKNKNYKGQVFNIPSLNNLDNASYQLKIDNQFTQSQINQQDNEFYDEYHYSDIDELELRKYEQIFLKKYDDEFISQFERVREYKEYFPKNNYTNVLEMISIRRKLNPFYRQLLLRKRVQNSAWPASRLHNFKKAQKNLNINMKSMYGASFLKQSQSYSVNTSKHNLSPSNRA